MSTVAERLSAVRARVHDACVRAGRSPEDVELIAVSKLQPASAIEEAYAAGQRCFGENYAQELRDKAQVLGALSGLRWHAIGPLQRNKAKYVARAAHVFHALDRLDVAEELSRLRQGEPLQCLIQVNLGDEATKSGIAEEALEPLAARVRALPNLALVGLTGLPPLGDTPEASRPYFQKLRGLAQRIGVSGLSMGTTADYEVAIAEGATWVRVGTAIFGERPAATSP